MPGHLRYQVSGGAEADFDLGYRVNLDGTRALLEACRKLAAPPKVVYASSVAAFGGKLPDVLDDSTTPTPQTSYGTQKVIGEYLLADWTRKGMADGRSLRLPTIVVRPGKPNLAAPAPRTPDGKPDLTGLWTRRSRTNSGYKPVDPVAVEAVVRKRNENFGKESGQASCLPLGPGYLFAASPDLNFGMTKMMIPARMRPAKLRTTTG